MSLFVKDILPFLRGADLASDETSPYYHITLCADGSGAVCRDGTAISSFSSVDEVEDVIMGSRDAKSEQAESQEAGS